MCPESKIRLNDLLEQYKVVDNCMFEESPEDPLVPLQDHMHNTPSTKGRVPEEFMSFCQRAISRITPS